MTFSYTTTLNYEVFAVHGKLELSSIIQFTDELNKSINWNKKKDLVLDLSDTEFIDSSGIRLIINLKKKIENSNAKLFVLKPSEAVISLFRQSNIDKVFDIIDTIEAVERKVAKDSYQKYLPYTTEEEGLHRINCSCIVCGSKNVVGYLIDQNSLYWQWIDDDPFPTSFDSISKDPCDFFSLIPIVCLECYMTSIRISDFNILDGDSVVYKSTLSGESKNILARAIKKRRKMVERYESVNGSYFMYPRSIAALYKIYLLAEFCSRTINVFKVDASPFYIGYLNYIAIKYADVKDRSVHINNCRTWFSQALNNISELTVYEQTLSYFTMLIANMNLNKTKDAADMYLSFSEMIKKIPSTVESDGIMSPHFWFKQAHEIWEKDIEKKSEAMII